MYTEVQLNKIIGRNIKYYRELYNVGKPRQSRITQEKLAELAEISTSLVGNMESEKIVQGVSLYTLYKISNILQVSIDNFFVPLNKK